MCVSEIRRSRFVCPLYILTKHVRYLHKFQNKTMPRFRVKLFRSSSLSNCDIHVFMVRCLPLIIMQVNFGHCREKQQTKGVIYTSLLIKVLRYNIIDARDTTYLI